MRVINSIFIPGYMHLKDTNATAHSLDNDTFYTMVHLCANSKTYINLHVVYFLKYLVSNRGESVLVCINFMHDDASMVRCDKGL